MAPWENGNTRLLAIGSDRERNLNIQGSDIHIVAARMKVHLVKFGIRLCSLTFDSVFSLEFRTGQGNRWGEKM